MAPPPLGPSDMSGVDPGLQPTLIALLYLFPGLALSVLLVRFWRKYKDNHLGGDDALIALGWILSIGNTIITHMFTKAIYTGYRAEDVPHAYIDWNYAFKLQYALSVEYNPCICVIKASFLWTLYKLHSYNPWIKHSIVGLQVLNLVYMISTTIISAVPCLPVARAWDKSIPGGCYDPVLYVTGNVSVVIITDFLVLLIPTWIIHDLHMPLKRKIMTISFLSLGAIVIAIGIARLLWLLNAFKGKVNSYSVESAFSAIESSVAIIGTSGPTVKYLLGGCIPWLRPSFERPTTNKQSSNGYENNSGSAGTNRNRSQNNGTDIYGDWDSTSVRQDEIEMKNDWRIDSDTHSDEHYINSERPGIVKSVEWTMSSKENIHALTTDTKSIGRPEAQPAHIV